MRSIPRLLGLVVFAATLPALGAHAEPPILLVQQVGTTTIAPGDLVTAPATLLLTATAPAATFGTGTYELELEIRPSSQPFQNSPTHAGGVILNKTNVDVQWPGLSYAPPVGSWKWQARMKVGSGSTSAWVPFNNGLEAFTVAPPNTPDIRVSTSMTGFNLEVMGFKACPGN